MNWRKRTFDLILASFLLIICAPFMVGLLAYLLVREGRPLFYVADRMKTPDQSIKLWKLRTMTVVDHDHGVSGGDKSSRVTNTGTWLRRKRLDELPQLWNILRGDLSFVGPRPPLREYVERFPEIYDAVLRSRPGVTGLATLKLHHAEERMLAQCITADETDAIYSRTFVPRKAELDLIYQRDQSFLLDLRLIFQTISVLFGRQHTDKHILNYHRSLVRHQYFALRVRWPFQRRASRSG